MKKYYFYSFLAAIIAAVITFIYISTKPIYYRSVGKFLLINPNSESTINKSPYADESISKTVTESIKTKNFIKKIYSDANVQINDNEIKNIGDYIEADVIDESNVISINIYSSEKAKLNKIDEIFFTTLQNSGILSVNNKEIKYKIVEPFFTQENPVALQPIKYAGISFLGVLTIGMLLVYTFYLPEYYKFLNN